MAPDPLLTVLKRLESEPPIFTADEARFGPGKSLPQFEAAGLLRPAKPAECLACRDCGDSPCCPVQYVKNEVTCQQDGYICCPACGPVSIDADRLRRWIIDVEALLAAVSEAAAIKGPVCELRPGLVWRLGKARWAGHSREVFFVRRCRGQDSSAVAAELARRPKAIVLTATEATVRDLAKEVENRVFSLESTASWCDGTVAVDIEHVEHVIGPSTVDAKATAKRPPKRRGSRTADMDALVREMKEHLRAARDHAVHTRDRTGESQLLPRPTKKALGQRAGVEPHSVSRCFKDKEGRMLQILWDLAADLDQIIGYRG